MLFSKMSAASKSCCSSSVAIRPTCQKLLKLVDECGRYSKQNQCYFRYTAWLDFWVHVSPGSAMTLARGGGITNHHLITYSLCNISAKNYQNRLMCVEIIVCYIIVVFLRHGVVITPLSHSCLLCLDVWRRIKLKFHGTDTDTEFGAF